MERLHRMIPLLVSLLLLDQVTKTVAFLLADDDASGVIQPGYNPRFSLGIAGAPLAVTLMVMTLSVCCFICYASAGVASGRWRSWVPAAIASGALSNLIDRILYGAVRDFLAIGPIVLNVADVAVAAGVVAIVHAAITHRPALDVSQAFERSGHGFST